MRRLITYVNALFLGMILGMIFVAIVHAPPAHLEEKVCASGITIGHEIIAATNQTTILRIAETTLELIHSPAHLLANLADHGFRASSNPIAVSDSLVKAARYQQPCTLQKQGARLPSCQ